MSAKAGKRPLRSLTAHEKLDAIRRVHEGESKASVARDIGVPESTLRGWCKNEDKISYLSRQSSPETDESLEPKEKRLKIDDSPLVQPFNLSLKASTPVTAQLTSYSPNSDFSRVLENGVAKNNELKTSERERNRAELARLSVELGLNRPEMFGSNNMTSSASLADLTANISLLAQWNSLLLQQQSQKNSTNATSGSSQKKVSSSADTTSNLVTSSFGGGLLTTVDSDKVGTALKPPKDKQSVNDYVSYWLKTQQAMLGFGQTTPSSTSGSGSSASTNKVPTSIPTTQPSLTDQSSWFWKWYKQFACNQPIDRPILYQQLTKAEPPTSTLAQSSTDFPSLNLNNNNNHTNNKARTVLDNLLFNNNNVKAEPKTTEPEEESTLENTTPSDSEVTYSEAVQHGEQFLKWLESCSEPSVTAVQIMQFRGLLNNVKSGQERKNGEGTVTGRAKVRRK